MISYVIPTYNDYKNLKNILSAIKNSIYPHEIIIVDDGSSHQAKDSIKQILKTYKKVKLITHKTNMGKSKAMKTGILNSNFSIITFIDSDLIGLKTKNINKLVTPVVKGDFDITLSRKESGLSKFAAYYGLQQNFTGERCILKEILMKNLDLFDMAKNYAVETEMNKRFYDKYKIAVVSWPNVANPAKTRHGIIKGTIKQIKMDSEILSYVSKKELIKQIQKVKKFPVIE